jgi:hypothetical protein
VSLTPDAFLHLHVLDILAAGEVKRRAEEKSATKKKTLIGLHPDDRYMWDHLDLQCCSFGVPLEQYVPSTKGTWSWRVWRRRW